MPFSVAKVLMDLAEAKSFSRRAKQLTLKRAQDYAPKIIDGDYVAGCDVPWLDRFAADGGRAIISADVKMTRERTHEMLALYQHGFIVISFERQWGNWNFYHKVSLMIHWWDRIISKIRDADRGTFWVVPSSWPIKEDVELRNVSLGLAQLLKDNPNRSKKIKTTGKIRRPVMAGNDQQSFLDILEPVGEAEE